MNDLLVVADERTGDKKYRARTIESPCVHCGNLFTQVRYIGRWRTYCSQACVLAARPLKAKAQPQCVTEGCSNHRGYSSGICNSCYYRVRRTGTIDRKKYAYRSITTHGYVVLNMPNHPLGKDGRVYEHRKVLFDSIGDGEHQCYWCSDSVSWMRNGKGAPRGGLVVDHLDGDKTNNAIANLVPACNKCNSSRGMFQAWVSNHRNDPWLAELFKRFSKE